MNDDSRRAVLISGSPSARSRSKRVLEAVGSALEREGVECEVIDLSRLQADALLGRVRSADVEAALDAVRDAAIVAASTPVYRATYSGLLKVFFDLLEPGALRGRAGIAIATGGTAAHQLVIEHGLAPLFTSVGATVVPTGIYAADATLTDIANPDVGADAAPIDLPPALSARVARAASEAVRLATALSSETSTITTSATL